MTSHRPVIVGIGATELGRDLPASATELAVAACRAALADAGLSPGDVDGITSFVAAYEGAPLLDVIPALGLDPERLRVQSDVMALSPAAVTAVVDAADAVREGRAETVLAFKTNKWKR
ncbi:MAG: lipid-transfer protein, partial [Candidatus Binatia bacterium]